MTETTTNTPTHAPPAAPARPGRALIRGGRVLTMGAGPGPRRGRALSELGVLERADVLIDRGVVTGVGADLSAAAGSGWDGEIVQAEGRVVMPAFVDAHTHLCWAGDRLGEWAAKLGGASYLELMARGGGIMSTVRAVRAATQGELEWLLSARLASCAAEGTGTIEIKSGYGLTTADELKMLRAIGSAGAGSGAAGAVAEASGLTVIPTACIGHAIDPDVPGFVGRTIEQTLPAVSAAFPGICVDAYVESGAWSVDDGVGLLARAVGLGHPVRVHADQFNSLGMVEEAIGLGANSVDHLEASGPGTLDRLAASNTYGVMLPCSGFHLDGRYADGRRFVDAGGALVIATNANPGSAPCWSVPMAVALAVRHLGLTAAEAISACTVNAAALLGLSDRGRVAVGMRGGVIVLDTRDERELAWRFGGRRVWWRSA